MITISMTFITLKNLYYIFGSVFSLIMAASQISLRDRKKINYILCSFFICNFIWLFELGTCYFFILEGYIIVANILNIFSIPASALACSLFFLFFKSLLVDNYRLTRQDFRHFVFPLLITIVFIGNIAIRFEYIGTMIYYLEPFSAWSWYLFLIIHLGYLVYFLYELLLILKNRQTKNRKIIHILLFLNGFLIINALISVPTISLIPIILVVVHLTGYRYPEILKVLETEQKRARYSRSQISQISQIDYKDIANRLNMLMVEDKLFYQEDLTLKVVSDLLDIRTHQLSEILNNRFGKNFTTYINEFRVKEAAQFLTERPELSVLEIGYESGFNSSSSFYRFFKQVFDMSPGAYRKKNMK